MVGCGSVAVRRTAAVTSAACLAALAAAGGGVAAPSDATSLVSVGPGGVEGNLASCSPAISADGRFVAFDSRASNLVAGDTNAARDVFVRDRVAGVTRRV